MLVFVLELQFVFVTNSSEWDGNSVVNSDEKKYFSFIVEHIIACDDFIITLREQIFHYKRFDVSQALIEFLSHFSLSAVATAAAAALNSSADMATPPGKQINHPQAHLIQRDLNSPSANNRLRAIRALK